jgi:isoaspartyl peptidase/L-asparaginase-like protein (Ntn-hydrolase superfamily)
MPVLWTIKQILVLLQFRKYQTSNFCCAKGDGRYTTRDVSWRWSATICVGKRFQKENLLTDVSEQEWKEWLKDTNYQMPINIENHDTIGMIALDAHGNLSGACTTSGMAYKMHGRVGDSPIIGAGLYVDNEIGAATATGHGEEVIRIAGSHLVVELMRQGYSQKMRVRRLYIELLS